MRPNSNHITSWQKKFPKFSIFSTFWANNSTEITANSQFEPHQPITISENTGELKGDK